MKQLFSAFPAGFAGVALLLFRSSLALFLITTPSQLFPMPFWLILGVDLVALAIVLGFSTRILALSCAFAGIVIVSASKLDMPMLIFTQTIDAFALAMIGPGAFSVDARLFGRATITLPR